MSSSFPSRSVAAAAKPPPPPPTYSYPAAAPGVSGVPRHLPNAVVPRPPAAPQFFVDQKRGELYELRQVLRSLPTERDIGKQREALKKLMAYMTVGLDVSRLFADVVMLASTSDLVQKKMIYQYLINYAAINTFQKDCNDEDPRLRGLAIRSLCSLRLSCMLEYIDPAARKGMHDRSPYVRRAAVMGMLKVHKLLQELLATDEEGARQRMEEVRQRLYDALFDEDPQVAINAVYALNEVEAEEGGMIVTKQIATRFLNRIKKFSEWGVCALLNLIATYEPENEEEVFDIMNILDDKLKSSSAAVVLGCAKCFLHFTKNNEELRRQVYQRLRAPLLTLIGPAYAETSYTVLQHILLIIETGGTDAVEVFEGEARQFFCRYSDPSYMKATKLRILVGIATERNALELIREIQEYICDADIDIARQSIGSLGMIACRLSSPILEEVLTVLLSFVEMEIGEYLMSAIFIVFRDLLRRYPHVISRVTEAIRINGLRIADEADGYAAILWILGEFAEHVEGAPYLLEAAVDRFLDEPASVRLELLTATVKCFFKYPGETQPILGRLFEQAINDSSNPDVHDKALFYYRFLKADLQDAKKILATPLPPVEEIQSPAERQLAQQLLKEFNTLAVVYRHPRRVFLCEKPIPFGGRRAKGSRKQTTQSTVTTTNSSNSPSSSSNANASNNSSSSSISTSNNSSSNSMNRNTRVTSNNNNNSSSSSSSCTSTCAFSFLSSSDSIYPLSPVVATAPKNIIAHAEIAGKEISISREGFVATDISNSDSLNISSASLSAAQQQQQKQQQNKRENALERRNEEEEEERDEETRNEKAEGGDLLSYLEKSRPEKREDKEDSQKITWRREQRQQIPEGASASSSLSVLRLLPSAALDSTEFQSLWESVEEDSSSTSFFKYKITAAASQVLAHAGSNNAAAETLSADMEAATAEKKIFTMASGVLENTLKLFLYAEDIKGVLYLCEVQLDLLQQDEEELRLTVKSVHKQEKTGAVSVLDAVELQQHNACREMFAAVVQQAVVDLLLRQQQLRGANNGSGLAVL